MEPPMKKRKANWGDDEVLALSELVNVNKDVIHSKFTAGVTADKKRRIWESITGAINSRYPASKRTREEVEKKWQNVKSKAKNELSVFRRTTTATGGGPASAPLDPVTQTVSQILGKDNPSIIGITDLDSTMLQTSSASCQFLEYTPSLTPPFIEDREALYNTKIKLEIECLRLKKELLQLKIRKEKKDQEE